MIKKWLKDIFDTKETFEFKEWRTDNSIHKFLTSNLDITGNLNDAANDLPDEKKDDGNIRFAPGLLDAMLGADDSEDSKKKINGLSKLAKKIANKGDKFSEQEFYRIVSENEGVISIIDDFLQAVVNESLPIQPYLFKFAKDLATKTDKRNAVKFGIAILGLCQNKSVINDVKILGLHDEFTIYSAIAITNLSDNKVNDLWDLAKRVDGWGKIQIVDRLAQPDLDEPIKDWLIYEGYKNSIMYEYLAFACASNGELHKRLESEKITNKLFKSASDIIEALIVEHSPSADISSYTYASSVIENFVRHAKLHASDISDFNSLHKIKDFLTELQNDIGEHKSNGWNQDIISNCIIDIVELLKSKDWIAAAYEGLKSKHNILYWNAKQAAEKLGIDLWETVWQRLIENPLDSSSWYDVTHYSKPEYSDQIIDFAAKNLPLDELSTGPKDSMGVGPNYHKFMCLDYAITFLENYPQKGEVIILTGLQCPVTRNRNMAIKVLDKWKKANWSTKIVNALNHLKTMEPNKDTQENIERLINGQELK
jgi:hypothetical protein